MKPAEKKARAETIPDTSKPAWASAGWMPVDWTTEKPPTREYLFRLPDGPGVVPMGVPAMLVAGGSAGKSHAAIQMALSLATGARWLGLFEPERTGRVALFMGEEPLDEMRRRMFHNAKLLCSKGPGREALDGRILPVSTTSLRTDLLGKEGNEGDFYSELKATLTDMVSDGEPWRAIVFDPLTHFAGLDVETDNASAAQLMKLLAALASELPGSPTVLVCHHTTKTTRHGASNVSAARGSGALTDNARCVLNLEQVPDPQNPTRVFQGLVRLSLSKNNYGSYATGRVNGETINGAYLTRYADHGGALWFDPASLRLCDFRDAGKHGKSLAPDVKDMLAEVEQIQDEDTDA